MKVRDAKDKVRKLDTHMEEIEKLTKYLENAPDDVKDAILKMEKHAGIGSSLVYILSQSRDSARMEKFRLENLINNAEISID